LSEPSQQHSRHPCAGLDLTDGSTPKPASPTTTCLAGVRQGVEYIEYADDVACARTVALGLVLFGWYSVDWAVSLSKLALNVGEGRTFGMSPLAGLAQRANRGQTVSTHVHRDGSHQITVRDDAGREAALVEHDRTLQITTTGAGPHLTPQMAHDLADALHQWATGQQTVRSHGQGRDR